MKNRVFTLKSFLIIPFILSVSASAQMNFVSSDGYVVDIYILPQSVIPSSSSCVNGYNYNLNLKYQITFSGRNIPANLWTLQGTVNCGSSSLFFDLPNNGGVGTTNTTSNPWHSITDCNTSTPTSLGCTTVNIEIAGSGIVWSPPISYPISYVPLPVTFTNFKAISESKRVKLIWETASESNSDYFTIQRSANQNEWVDIEIVNAAGNSSTTKRYASYDEFPVKGNSYYRIKQTDIDGEFIYSTISSVKMEAVSGSIFIFPNPNTNNTIKINGLTDYKMYSMSLTDLNGKQLFSTHNLASSLTLPKLKTGIYLVTFINKVSNEQTTLRYLKL